MGILIFRNAAASEEQYLPVHQP